MGGGGSSENKGASWLALKQAEIAEDLDRQTSPMRNTLIRKFENALDGEGSINARKSPLWGPLRDTVDSQYQHATGAMMGDMPAGGDVADMIARLQAGRQYELGLQEANLGQDMMEKIYGVAWGVPGQAMGNLGQASGTLGAIETAENNIKAQKEANETATAVGAASTIATIATMIALAAV